jgi:hypothetical protein
MTDTDTTLACVEVDQASMNVAAAMDPSRRRGLFAAAGALVGGLAVLVQKTPAQASHECLGQPHCCSLAKCNWCNYAVSRDRFNCSEWPGYKRLTWSCSENGRLAWCGECAIGPTCHNGGFKCSIWFWN